MRKFKCKKLSNFRTFTARLLRTNKMRNRRRHITEPCACTWKLHAFKLPPFLVWLASRLAFLINKVGKMHTWAHSSSEAHIYRLQTKLPAVPFIKICIYIPWRTHTHCCAALLCVFSLFLLPYALTLREIKAAPYSLLECASAFS